MQRPTGDQGPGGPGRSTMQRTAPDENHGALESKRETILRHLDNVISEVNSLPAGLPRKGTIQSALQDVRARINRIGRDEGGAR